MLIGAGALLELRDQYGWTPLMVAQKNHPDNEVLLALLSGSGPVNQSARHSVRPLRQDSGAGISQEPEGMQPVRGRALLRHIMQRGRMAQPPGGVQGAEGGA